MLNAFGRNYEELGSSDKGLILRNSGKIKILWGKSYFDLLDNNGKLNVKIDTVIKAISSESEVINDGFYYNTESKTLTSKVGENVLEIALTSGMSFISFMEEQELESDLKYTALKNIGFIYPNVLEVLKFPTDGIVYNEADLSLYIIKNGTLLNKYQVDIPSFFSETLIISKADNNAEGALKIVGKGEENALLFDSLKIYNENDTAFIKVNDGLVIKDLLGIILLVVNNTLKVDNIETNGFRVAENRNGKYVLEVNSLSADELNWPKRLEPYRIGKRNLITHIEELESSFKLVFKYPQNYQVGNLLRFYLDIPLRKVSETLLLPVTCTMIDSSSITDENAILISGFTYDLLFIQEYSLKEGPLTEEEILNIDFKSNIIYKTNIECYLVTASNYSFDSKDYILYQSYLTNTLTLTADDNILVPMKLLKALNTAIEGLTTRVTALENSNSGNNNGEDNGNDSGE